MGEKVIIEPITVQEYNVHHINSIEHLYKSLRNKSKAPTFALNYQGTYRTLMNNCGFSEEEAKTIEKNFHKMYKVSDQWVENKLQQACKDGFVSLAFGLKLRTPLLKKSILNTRVTLNQAEKEARTAGNALSGQSYGLLTNRAMIAVMRRVWNSLHRYDIHPCGMIHDAVYFTVKRDIDCVLWLNQVLIEEMEWQELPEIQHPEIKLGAELEIFNPDWSTPITIPNHADKDHVTKILQSHNSSG